ncbi:TolC family protein [candidate division CSSED10-310 bacterium]|uniref:TolC family protein n=1 Tax=candidate division CSSED10-310 bacterium TaxID=2855610 RepID=A0ABV6YWP4_UNCC1
MMKSFMRTLIIATLISTSSVFGAPAVDSVEELAQLAVEQNQAVHELNAQISALKEKSQAVRIFKDPMVGLSFVNYPWDSLSLGETPMTGIQLRVEQEFPLPGKNQRRQAVVESEIKAREWAREELKIQLKGMVKESYFKLTLVRQLKVIIQQHIILVTQFLDAVQAKYESGKANQHDVLRLELLQDKLKDDLNDFTQKEREISSAINATLHRNITINITTPVTLSAPEPNSTFDMLLEHAKETRPLLSQIQEMSEMKKRAAQLAALERYPDFKLWSSYRYREEAGLDDGTDFLSFGASIAIPIDYLKRFKAKEKQHEFDSVSFDRRYDSIVDSISSQLEGSLAKWERAFQKYEKYHSTLVPDARKTLDATFAAYQTDRVDFASLYQAELQLLDFEREIQISSANAAIMQVNIETLTGRTLKSTLQKGE